MKKFARLAVIAGIVVPSRSPRHNPETKQRSRSRRTRQDQAKHLAEEAGEKVKARTSQLRTAWTR